MGTDGRASTDRRLTSDVRELFRHATIYLPSRVVPVGLTLVSLPVMARVLGPREFGVFSLVSVSIAYATALFGDWVVAAYQREAQYGGPALEADAAGWSAAISLTGAIVLAVAGWYTATNVLLYLSALVPPTVILRMQWAKLQMFGRSKRYSQSQIIYSTLKSGALAGACVMFHTVGPMIFAWAVVSVIVIAIGPRLKVKLGGQLSALRRATVIGGPLVLVSIALNGLSTADRFILASLRGKADVGVYSIAYMLADGTIMLLASLPLLAIYPQVAAYWDAGEIARATSLVRRMFRIQAAALAVAFVLATSVIVPLLPRLVGSGYELGPILFVIVGAGNILAAGGQLLALRPMLDKSTAQLGTLYGVVALLNLPLTAGAVALGGAVGAGVATLVSYIILLVVLVRRAWPTLLGTSEVGTTFGLAGVSASYGIALWLTATRSSRWMAAVVVAILGMALLVMYVWSSDRAEAEAVPPPSRWGATGENLHSGR